MLTNRGAILVFVASLVAVMAFGGVVRVATAEDGRSPSSMGRNSITVVPCDNDDWRADFDGTDARVTVVKVAEAVPLKGHDAYEYDFAAMGFDGISVPAQPTDEDWAAVASAVARNLTGSEESYELSGEVLTVGGLTDGMYLLLPHGGDRELAYGDSIASSLSIETDEWAYSYAPSLVALPYRIASEQAPTAWETSVTVTMKPTREERGGTLPPDTGGDEPAGKVPDGGRRTATVVARTGQPDDVRTGDDLDLTPLYLTMAISGAAFVALCAFEVRDRRRSEKGGAR